MAAAVATFTESTPGDIGIRTCRATASSAAALSPGPSAPSTRAARSGGAATTPASVHRFVRAAWPQLKEHPGTVLLTGSVVGLDGSANQAAYCATKAGVVMLTKTIALDGAPHGVRANCVCPGFTETPMLETFLAEQDDPDAVRAYATGLHPAGRLGSPRDIADAFVYLGSDEAAWVTGVALPVDGGLLAGI